MDEHLQNLKRKGQYDPLALQEYRRARGRLFSLGPWEPLRGKVARNQHPSLVVASDQNFHNGYVYSWYHWADDIKSKRLEKDIEGFVLWLHTWGIELNILMIDKKIITIGLGPPKKALRLGVIQTSPDYFHAEELVKAVKKKKFYGLPLTIIRQNSVKTDDTIETDDISKEWPPSFR